MKRRGTKRGERSGGQLALRFSQPRAAPPRAAKLPPCEPRPKRVRSASSATFCESSAKYCSTDPLYVAGTSSLGKWDTRMVLVVGLLVLVAWSSGGQNGKPPPQITPGPQTPPQPREDRQPSLPHTQAL